MVSQFRLVLAATALATVAAVGAAQAPQSQPDGAQPPAPIQRVYPGQYQSGQMPRPVGPAETAPVAIAPGQTLSSTSSIATAMPMDGVMLRVGTNSSVREVSSDAQKLELSVERGVANVNVHDPGKDVLILVDLPGGQTQLLKNGLYTFNAQTNTARVLKGEALAFPGADKSAGVKPLKVKENHDVAFNGTDVKPHDFAPYEARMDLLVPPAMPDQGGAGYYGYGPYGDGFYGSPYWAYDYYPWGGYPYYGYGYGYPFGVGLGFGYVGGWGHYGGGFGGFHGGGGFHGRR